MFDNLYLNHIESIPNFIRNVFSSINQEALRISKEISHLPLQSVYLYGSGDSWCAALGAAGAFMELCKLPAYPLTSLQASRYAPGYCMPKPESVLVIGVSNSGRMIRGVEATMALSKAGYSPVLITSAPDSPGAKAAGKVFLTPSSPKDPIPLPGVKSFVIAQLSLYLLAVHLAHEKNLLDTTTADKLIEELSSFDQLLPSALNANREKLQSFANLCAKEERVEFLSGGSCKASADFGMAKTLEATGYTALSPELEEFAHMNFFSLYPEHIPTVLICPDSARFLNRCLELEQSMRYQKRPYIVITDSNRFLADEEHTIKVPFFLTEKFAPLTLSFLSACLTAYMPLKENDIYMHGHMGPYFEGPFSEGEGFPTIMNSKITL